MIFCATTAHISTEFADVLPGNLTAKAAFLRARLPENCVTVTCLDDCGLLEVTGQWPSLEKTHDILQAWIIAEHRSEGKLVDAGVVSMLKNKCGNGSDHEFYDEEVTVVYKRNDTLVTVKSEPKYASLAKMADVVNAELVKSPRKRGRPRKQVNEAVTTNVNGAIRRSKRTITPRSFSPTPVKKREHNTSIESFKTIAGAIETVITAQLPPPISNTRSRLKAANEKRRGKINRLIIDDDVGGLVKLQCDDCKYSTTSEKNLINHRRRVHMSYDFACELCSETFALNEDLVEHKHCHENRFPGDYCHEVAADAHQLATHISRQHPDTLNTGELGNDRADRNDTSAVNEQDVQLSGDVTESTFADENEVDSWMSLADDVDLSKGGSSDVVDENDSEEDWPDDYPVKCALCKHQTTSQLNLQNHVQRMHMERKHECRQCHKKFGFKKDLTEHQRWHTKTHECPVCQQKFATLYVLNVHLSKAHGKEVEDKERSANQPQLPLYGCKQCSYITKFHRNFRNHLYRNHGEKKLQCVECSKRFALPKDLKQHMIFHTVQVFPCNVCGKKLKSKFALQVHTDGIHKGIKKTPKAYLCTLCGKLCRNITAYKEHQNKEHLHVKPFACDACGMSFHGKAPLNMHKLKHRTDRNFVCQVCEKAFKGQASLNAHLVIHKNVRPFECDTCKKGFTQKAALTRHCRIHTGERPYKCKLCGSNFNDASILRRHMIGIHKISSGKIIDDVEWEGEDKPQLTSSENYSEPCVMNDGPRLMVVKTEETCVPLKRSRTLVIPTSVHGQSSEPCTDIVMLPALQNRPESVRLASPPVATQSVTVDEFGVVEIAAGSKEAPQCYELCSVTNAPHMGVVTISNNVSNSDMCVSPMDMPAVGEHALSSVVNVADEKTHVTAWDSQVVSLALESNGVYILVADSVIPEAGEMTVTTQDTSDYTGH